MTPMYGIALAIHNLIRWIVLIAAAWTLIRAYRGWALGGSWAEADRRAGLLYSIVLDVQLLVGVLLLLLSPLVRAAVADFGASMGSEQVRFILIEHVPLMVLAIVLAHLGGAAARKASDDVARHRRSAIWYTLATLAVVLAVPWWRPLFPGLG